MSNQAESNSTNTTLIVAIVTFLFIVGPCCVLGILSQ